MKTSRGKCVGSLTEIDGKEPTPEEERRRRGRRAEGANQNADGGLGADPGAAEAGGEHGGPQRALEQTGLPGDGGARTRPRQRRTPARARPPACTFLPYEGVNDERA